MSRLVISQPSRFWGLGDEGGGVAVSRVSDAGLFWFLGLQDFLGQAFCTLGEIVGSSGSRLEKPLT
jgi:hypothetical protein